MRPGCTTKEEISRLGPSREAGSKSLTWNLLEGRGCLPLAKTENLPESRLCEYRAAPEFDVGKILHLEQLAKMFFGFIFKRPSLVPTTEK
jgi:hypothetical protein